MAEPTVHILHEGRALCAKPGPPGNWGPGHKWVARDTDVHGDRSNANCSGCVAGYKLWRQDPDSFFTLMEALARNASDRTFDMSLATLRFTELEAELARWKSVAEKAGTELGVARLRVEELERLIPELENERDAWKGCAEDDSLVRELNFEIVRLREVAKLAVDHGDKARAQVQIALAKGFTLEPEGPEGPEAPGPQAPKERRDA